MFQQLNQGDWVLFCGDPKLDGGVHWAVVDDVQPHDVDEFTIELTLIKHAVYLTPGQKVTIKGSWDDLIAWIAPVPWHWDVHS